MRACVCWDGEKMMKHVMNSKSSEKEATYASHLSKISKWKWKQNHREKESHNHQNCEMTNTIRPKATNIFFPHKQEQI